MPEYTKLKVEVLTRVLASSRAAKEVAEQKGEPLPDDLLVQIWGPGRLTAKLQKNILRLSSLSEEAIADGRMYVVVGEGMKCDPFELSWQTWVQWSHKAQWNLESEGRLLPLAEATWDQEWFDPDDIDDLQGYLVQHFFQPSRPKPTDAKPKRRGSSGTTPSEPSSEEIKSPPVATEIGS